MVLVVGWEESLIRHTTMLAGFRIGPVQRRINPSKPTF
jgi:hypothetical protein